MGALGAVAASNRTVVCDQIHIWRVEDGLITEHWMCMDELGAMRQIGVTLPDAQAPARG